MADLAGNTRTTAFKVPTFGSIASTRTYRDSISPSDTNDYYRIGVGRRSSLDIDLLRLGNNLNLELVNSTGTRVLKSSKRVGTRDENINITLNKGVYFLRVFPANAARGSRYALRLSGRPDNAGETQATARAIGDITGNALEKSFSDYVGASDLSDYYSFALTERKTVDLLLNGLTGDAKLELRNAANSVLLSSNNVGTASESVTAALDAGTYYVRVAPNPKNKTGYKLGVSVSDDPATTPETALSLDIGFSTKTYRNSIGLVNDTVDLYKFSLLNNGDFNLLLDGLNATTDVEVKVYNADDTSFLTDSPILQANAGGLGENETISGQLAQGNYLLKVSRVGNSGHSVYQLATSALPEDRAGNTLDATDPEPRSLNLTGTSIRSPFILSDADSAPEFIGTADPADIYVLDLNSAGRTFFSLKLTNSGGNADVLMFQDLNGNGTLEENTSELISISARSGSSAEDIAGTFLDGTYYVVVRPGANNEGSFYDLKLYTAPGGSVPSIAKDIAFGGGSSQPKNLTDVNGALYFVANDGDGFALWKSEGVTSAQLGTVQTTTKVKGFSGQMSNLTNVEGTLYFTADDGQNGTELWVSNGTEAGTRLVKDIAPTGSSAPRSLTAVGSTLYFAAADTGNNYELWKTDGTEAGTVKVAEILAGNNGALLDEQLKNVNGTLYFTANNGTNGIELYRLDAQGLPELIDIAVPTQSGQTTSSIPQNLTVVNNTLYFTANTTPNGREIWKINNSGNAVRLTDIGADQQSSGAQSLTVVGNKLFFSAFDDNSIRQLYSIDTASNDALTKLTDITTDLGADPLDLIDVDGTLYFTAVDAQNGREIWKSDGTINGTTRATTIADENFVPSQLININGTVYFTAAGLDNGAPVGTELWRYTAADPSPVVELVFDILPGADGSNPEELTNISGRLFFRADNSIDLDGSGTIEEGEGNGAELWGL